MALHTIDFITLSLQRASISDSSYFFDDATILNLERAQYQLSIDIESSEQHSAIRSLKVRQIQARELSRGERAGAIGVDFGEIAICDRDSAEHEFSTMGDDKMDVYFKQLGVELYGKATLPGGTQVALVRPGPGDGEYDIHQLVDPHGLVRGFEITFS